MCADICVLNLSEITSAKIILEKEDQQNEEKQRKTEGEILKKEKWKAKEKAL